MKPCTACNKAYATIHILDLDEGAIVEEQHLCAGCAEGAGMGQPKAIKLNHADVLELISSIKGGEGRRGNLVCPACQLTAAEFKVRGRMGCGRCYETFKEALLPLLERVHDATSHRGRCPGPQAASASPASAPSAKGAAAADVGAAADKGDKGDKGDKASKADRGRAGRASGSEAGVAGEAGEAAGSGEAEGPGGAGAARKATLRELRDRLDAAIQVENYEEAAQLRDQIRAREAAEGGGAREAAEGGGA